MTNTDRLAQALRVPDSLQDVRSKCGDTFVGDISAFEQASYNEGWNACREATIAALASFAPAAVEGDENGLREFVETLLIDLSNGGGVNFKADTPAHATLTTLCTHYLSTAPALPCGHHASLAINSAEDGRFLYCDLCDAKSGRRDAEHMERKLTAQVAALTAQCEADKRDAELWRALLGCKRIRILGTAGFGDGNINGLGHYRHFGAEFWTRYGEDVKDAFDGLQVITEFATEAAAAGNGEGV